MNLKDWLTKQQRLYPEQNLPEDISNFSIHPISGDLQENSPYLKSRFFWGGGASQAAFQQLEQAHQSGLNQVAVITFGPVQTFLGGGQRLRDWSVASWLCHYLSATLIYRWRQLGGKVLLPLHDSCDLVNWFDGSQVDEQGFWQAGLPNVITGLHIDEPQWLEKIQLVINEEWGRFLKSLEKQVVEKYPKLLNGHGWRVIHNDHKYLWSVYAKSKCLQIEELTEDIDSLHKSIESEKIGRKWQGTWWGGRTSPSDGCLSIWHPGLKLITDGGTWGLPDDKIKEWWEAATTKTKIEGLFSSDDRLNSIELVKRLASIPKIIEPTLKDLWGNEPPTCPWERFPDRTAVAAAWVIENVNAETWNTEVEFWYEYFLERTPIYEWGIPKVDIHLPKFAHPRVLERRNLDLEDASLNDWKKATTEKNWESTIEWTVGWRGDGDNMGKWLSGKQYTALRLPWSKWHPDGSRYGKEIHPVIEPIDSAREIEIPHMLDLSMLFGIWNKLLYRLTEEYHHGRVIFAGGDDFLLLGPLTEAITLTNDLHRLWTGESTPLTQPLNPSANGWVIHQNQIYPVPGKEMNFSLGVVIAQRRIPQSLWHRGLNQAYKEAKNQGRNRICIRVLFNSGQSLDWVCPWPLWNLLMPIEPMTQDNTELNRTELNRWEKLLTYMQSSRLQKVSIFGVGNLIETLWMSVGIPLKWECISAYQTEFEQEIGSWQWWINWISLKAFLARQQRERQKWIQQMQGVRR